MPITTGTTTHRNLYIEIDGKVGNIEVAKKVYRDLKVGDEVEALYRIGRFSGKVYLSSIRYQKTQ